MITKYVLSAFSAGSLLLMSGCGGSGGGSAGDSDTSEQTYTLSGTVSGLGDDTVLTLRLNDAEDVNLSGSGTFSFATEIIEGGSYSVTVESVKSSTQLPILYDCSVSPAGGTVGVDETDINVSCKQRFFFSATDGSNGQELWQTDGTEEGTVMVKDIHVGVNGSNPGEMTVMNNLLYFSASPDGIGGYELWRSDGTENGTVMLSSVTGGESEYGSVGANPRQLTSIGDTLYFLATTPRCGYNVWQTVDSDSNVSMVRNIKPCDTAGNGLKSEYLLAAGDTLYFAIDDVLEDDGWGNLTEEYRLYKTVDTEENATKVVDGVTPWLNIGNIVIGDTLYFAAEDATHGVEIWKTDPEYGAVMLKDISEGPGWATISGFEFTKMGDFLYFSAEGGLWRTDGTAENTILVKALESVDYLYATEDTLYFSGNDGIHNSQAWKSDGTTAGTVMFKELRPGSSAAPSGWVQIGDSVYFRGKDASGVYRLWKTVSTDENASVVAPDIEVSAINYMKAVGDTLYFVADGGDGNELWKTVNTDENVMNVLDVDSGSAIGSPSDYEFMYTVGDTLYFWVGDSTHGVELWKTVAGGARIVKDINAGLADSK